MGELGDAWGSLFSGMGDTWLGGIFTWISSSLGLVAGLAVVAVVLGGVGYSVLFIGKGGGQYGIIEGYVGTIGAGKTTLAVQHALFLAKARNAVLLSNIPVICGPTCTKLPGESRVLPKVRKGQAPVDPGCSIQHATLPMNDTGLDLETLTRTAFQLRDESRGLVLLMDEVGVIMPARLWKDFSVALMWVLQQSRKLACEWIWTAQDPSFVDHQLRSLTAVVHYVKCYPPPSVWRRVQGKRPWLMVASAFTPQAAPRANGDSLRADRRLGRKMFRYQRRWESAFDTDGVVLPSKHLKGAEVLIRAVGADAHAIHSGGGWGEGMGGAEGDAEAEGAGA